MPTQGLILFAHGARDARWAEPFERVATQVRATRPGVAVSLAYLEFMAPDLDAAGAALVGQDCLEVAILPLFLGAGGHVRKDLPARVEKLRAAHPAVKWTLCAAAGESDVLVDALARIAVQSLEERG
jgi:sirohydrochlorin cobaltochelatase